MKSMDGLNKTIAFFVITSLRYELIINWMVFKMTIQKFRAWLKEEKRMTDVNEMTFIDGEVQMISDVEDFYAYDEFKLMQSTGLKDKNGNEIYDGDIVRFTLKDGFSYVVDEFGEVIYKIGSFYILNGLSEYLISDIKTNDIEVVGNIHGILELLGGK